MSGVRRRTVCEPPFFVYRSLAFLTPRCPLVGAETRVLTPGRGEGARVNGVALAGQISNNVFETFS